jgi:hypothetical protein
MTDDDEFYLYSDAFVHKHAYTVTYDDEAHKFYKNR